MNKALALIDLLTIDKIFKELGGTMFLLFGTALGAYRDKGFVEHDDDIDLGSFDTDIRDKVADKMRQAGFDVDIVWDEKINGYRESVMIHARHDVHVDIFFFVDTDEGYVACRGVEEEPFVKLPPWTKKEFETVRLHNNNFKILSPGDKYLEFCYSNWKTPSKEHGKLYHDLLGKKFEYTLFHGKTN